MRILVESLKRLYSDGKISKTQLLERVEKKSINIEEYNHIVEENED